MRNRIRVSVVVIGVVLVAGCGSDKKSATSQASSATSQASTETAAPASSGPFVASPGLIPADAAELTGAADIRAALLSLGFPSGWFVPAGVSPADVVGMSVSQSAGSEETRYTYGFAFRQPAGVVDDLAKSWYEQYASALGIGKAEIIGNKSRGDITGRLYSGGLPEDPAGALDVTIVGADGGTEPVIVETELAMVVSDGEITLRYSPEMLAQLPDITTCTPSRVDAELALYASPNNLVDEPTYTTIFDAACQATTTFDASVEWSDGRDGIITQDDKHIEITNTTGANGTLIHVGAYAGGNVRIDTEQPVNAG